MRVLIVGCGYVGIPLGAKLVQQGHDVFGLRRTASRTPELLHAGIHPLDGDVTRFATLQELPPHFDWVVHCAATSGGSVEDYRRLYFEGTRNLLAWLNDFRPQRFVYTSSTSVYGQADGSAVDETSPAEPLVETARILVETEKLLLEAARQRQFPAVILRVAGIYGPDRGYGFKQYLTHQARIESKGERMLNMIHRDDLVSAIIKALERGRPGEIYNAVDDEPVNQLKFFEWLAGILGGPLPPFAEDTPSARKRGFTNKQVSNRKLRTELGLQLQYPTFRDGYLAEIQRLGSRQSKAG